jgi:chemotaxis signal transduction protein
VEGISNLRGVVLPIFDIRARFGMKREEHTDRSRVLVIDIDGKRTGLVVDGVRQVTRVERSEFEPPPAAIRSETTDYIDGVVKLDDGARIIIALDARRVCAFPGNEISVNESLGNAAHEDASSLKRAVGSPARGPKLVSGHGPVNDGPVSDGSVSDGLGETAAQGIPDNGAEGLQASETGAVAAKGGNVHQLVSFQVGREEFAFPMEHVREILRVQTPKEVPGAPEYLLGVLTVRGKILPIIDLRRLLRQSSFASDHSNDARLASALFRALMERRATGGDQRAELHAAVAASEELRRWLTSFNSSSQVLTETLSHARGLNEHVSKQSGPSNYENLDDAGMAALRVDLLTSVESILGLLDTFSEQLEGNIREDQRIIVVESNGLQLGLVVDHVNEVLSVPEEAIEAPPSIAHQEGVGLSGIAKLEDGKRLILLLSTGNLLDRQKLALVTAGGTEEAVTDAGAGDASEATAAGPGKEALGEDTRGGDAAKKIAVEDTELQLVTFLLGKEEYGIPIAKIQEIDRLSNITKTPKAPKFVEGVTNLRGEVIPVLSTRSLFALETRASDDRTRVIIVDLGGAKTGLVVDSVKEVLSISTQNIAPPPASISNGAESQFISGIGKVDNGKRMIVLLDVGQVLTRGEQSELTSLAQSA